MKKSIIFSIIALVVVFTALLIFSGAKERAPEKIAPKPLLEVTKAPEPPPAEPSEDPALKDALLGLNKKPTIAEAQPKPRPVKRRAVRQTEEVVDEGPVEPEGPTSLSDYDFQSTVGSWTGVKSCIATNSQRGEDIKGALAVMLTVDADGSVVESRVVETSNEDVETIAPCVEKKARHIRFPTFAGNEQVTKTAKFIF